MGFFGLSWLEIAGICFAIYFMAQLICVMAVGWKDVLGMSVLSIVPYLNLAVAALLTYTTARVLLRDIIKAFDGSKR